MKWTANILERLPSNQCEVVFYCSPYEWRTGMFTPENFPDGLSEPVFSEYDIETGTYQDVDGVIGFIVLPPPLEPDVLGRIR